jgi:hypothetical protein
MTLFRAKTVFAAKVETTPGTAVSLTGTDAAFNVYNFELQPNISFTERLSQGGAGRLASIPAGSQGTATFRTEIGYNGTDIPNWASVLFPACGLVNNGSGVFFPRLERPGANTKTLTIGRYMDGKRRLLYGAMGTFNMVLVTGEMGYIDWTFSGIWGGETDVSILAPTYPTDGPLRVSGGTTTYNSVSACMQSCSFDVGNVVTGLQCNGSTSNTTGFEYFLVSDRNPRITGNPQSNLVATQDRYGMMLASTEAAFSISLAAPSTSAVTLAAPKAQIVSISEGDQERIAIDQIEWQCNKNGSTENGEFSISFT